MASLSSSSLSSSMGGGIANNKRQRRGIIADNTSIDIGAAAAAAPIMRVLPTAVMAEMFSYLTLAEHCILAQSCGVFRRIASLPEASPHLMKLSLPLPLAEDEEEEEEEEEDEDEEEKKGWAKKKKQLQPPRWTRYRPRKLVVNGRMNNIKMTKKQWMQSLRSIGLMTRLRSLTCEFKSLPSLRPLNPCGCIVKCFKFCNPFCNACPRNLIQHVYSFFHSSILDTRLLEDAHWESDTKASNDQMQHQHLAEFVVQRVLQYDQRAKGVGKA